MSSECWNDWDFGRLIVLRSSPDDLSRVRSQLLQPPWAQRCQGNCATILTLHCLNLPLSLALSLTVLLPSLRPKRWWNLLCALMMSAPQRSCLLNLNSWPSYSQWLDGGLEEGAGRSDHWTVEQLSKHTSWPADLRGSQRSWSFRSTMKLILKTQSTRAEK